jgi:hypothetical protein
MKKIGFMLMLVCFLSGITKAQFFIGANFGLTPYSQAASPVYKPGMGGNLNFKMFRGESKSVLGATLGFYSFSSKYGDGFVPERLPDTMVYSKKLSVIPLGLLYEYYFTDGKVKPYVGADFCYQLFKYSFLFKSNIETQDTYINVGKFTISPKAGVKVELFSGLHLGFEAKLDLVIATTNATQKPDYIDEPTFFIQVPLNIGLYYFIAP